MRPESGGLKIPNFQVTPLIITLSPFFSFFSSYRPDGLHSKVLKELADVVPEPLNEIFEKSWITGKLPEDWKRADVVPVFKKGGKVDPENYRPISLTSILGKILEKIIKE